MTYPKKHGMTYAEAGVDIDAGNALVRLIAPMAKATRRSGADSDWVVGAVLHDVGDGLAPQNHDKMSAEVIRPFVRWEVAWTVEHHGIFQTLYFGHHYGWDRNARDRYRDHPLFDTCAAFCEHWDQSSFDPDYASETLESFEPMVREVFSRKAYDPAVIRDNEITGLPEQLAKA